MNTVQGEEFGPTPRIGGGSEALQRKQGLDLAPVTWQDWVTVHCDTFSACIFALLLCFLSSPRAWETRFSEKSVLPQCLPLPGRFPWTGQGQLQRYPDGAQGSGAVRLPGLGGGPFPPEKRGPRPRPPRHICVALRDSARGHFPRCSAYAPAGVESARQ